MSNHVHLLIETPETNLGNGMQWLQSRYAMHFNQRYDRRGHLFETRFRSPMVTDHVRLARTVGYIVANPVAAALCSDPAEWRWGSHAMLADPPGWLAHSHLIDQLAASRGFAGYDALVAAHMSSRMLGGAR